MLEMTCHETLQSQSVAMETQMNRIHAKVGTDRANVRRTPTGRLLRGGPSRSVMRMARIVPPWPAIALGSRGS